jgi:hypothetical protein
VCVGVDVGDVALQDPLGLGCSRPHVPPFLPVRPLPDTSLLPLRPPVPAMYPLRGAGADLITSTVRAFIHVQCPRSLWSIGEDAPAFRRGGGGRFGAHVCTCLGTSSCRAVLSCITLLRTVHQATLSRIPFPGGVPDRLWCQRQRDCRHSDRHAARVPGGFLPQRPAVRQHPGCDCGGSGANH